MRITAATIKDFKRVRSIGIKPEAERNLILLAGKNRQGKTSVLGALTAAFGGAREIPPDPVRHGAEEASIHIVLDDGDLVITRTIEPDGSSKLEVRDQQGPVKAPQALLDRLIGLRFLDPISFLHLPAKEQRAVLLKLIDKDGKLAELEHKRERCFESRTDIGREVTRAKGELARIGDVVPVPEAVDVAALSAERAKLAEVRRKTDAVSHEAIIAQTRRQDAANSRGRLQLEVESIDRQIADLQKKRETTVSKIGETSRLEEQLRTAEIEQSDRLKEVTLIWASLEPRVAELDAKLAHADEQNRAVFKAQAANGRRKAAEDAVAKHQAGYDELTKSLEMIEARKLKILAAAKLPVANLNVNDGGLVLNGAPFESASGAEKLMVSLGLAAAASPGLDDVWIRDGALLDDDSLEMIEEHAKASGRRFWIERVGTDDDGAIIIQDGKVIGG